MKKEVMIVIGAGQISMAIARRMGYGIKLSRLNTYIKKVIVMKSKMKQNLKK